MKRFSSRKRRAMGFAAALAAAVLLAVGCEQGVPDGPAVEYIDVSGTEAGSGTNTPFTAAIKVNSGSIVFLSGTVGAPPHSHPHVASEFDHLDFSPEAQTERVMESLQEMIRAAGGELTDIIQVTKFMRDVEANQDIVRDVMARYWGPGHRPASTTIEIVRLATDPRFILEVEAVAVIAD